MSLVSRYLEPNLIQKLNQMQLSARRVVEGSITGLHRSPVKGASVEFRQHRFYTPGDDPRRLDWRVLARTDRPYIKEYDEETNLRGVLMLDCSGSMAYGGTGGASSDSATSVQVPARRQASRDSQAGGIFAAATPHPAPKFDFAARIVASLAYLMLGETEAVGLALFGEKVQQWLAPRSGTSQLAQVIDLLEHVAPQGPSRLGQAMQETADRLDKRSLIIAVSDGFNPVASIRQGLARLRHERHETILLQVLHPDEVNFPFRKWSRFRGLEGEPARICEPAIARQIYLEQFRLHRRELAETCRSLGAEFYSYVTDRPLIDCITLFLHRQASG